MKMTKLTAAVAATMAATAQAGTISGGDLDTVATSGSVATHVSAVAIVAPVEILDGLRTMQGIADCAGSLDVACSPSLSSAEVRSIVNNSTSNTQAITGGGTDLRTASGIKKAGIAEYAAGGVLDALTQFAGGGVIDGIGCGAGAAPAISNPTATDADTLAGMIGANSRFGFVHATELDGSVGFIKLDGVAPSEVALLSSNYNLVSNLSSAGTEAGGSANGITVNVAPTGAGVAFHNLNGAAAACAPADTGASIAEANGGTI